jgi:hypothetical protein
MRPTKLLCLALAVAACGVQGEVRVDSTQPASMIMAVIANRSATDLEMASTSEGEGHASEGGGAVPACTTSTHLIPAYPGDSWDLLVYQPDPAGPVQRILLSTVNRPDLAVPAGMARRVQITIDEEEAVLAGNVVLALEAADDNQGIEDIPDCP